METNLEGNDPWIWIDTEWKREDLDEKTVEFDWSLKEGGRIGGRGAFDITTRPAIDSFIRVEIAVLQWTGSEGMTARFYLPPEAVKRIVRNPPGSETEFSLFLI